jgi:hypothetical protein
MHRHRKTFQAIFKDPVVSNILWSDIEALLAALGAEISEGRGSRVRIVLRRVLDSRRIYGKTYNFVVI